MQRICYCYIIAMTAVLVIEHFSDKGNQFMVKLWNILHLMALSLVKRRMNLMIYI
nr:hypothetical protein CJLB15_00060 [Campylobacter phage CJLB-15]